MPIKRYKAEQMVREPLCAGSFETDMAAGQQRISPGFTLSVAERDTENPNGPQILAETGRKVRFSADSLYSCGTC